MKKINLHTGDRPVRTESCGLAPWFVALTTELAHVNGKAYEHTFAAVDIVRIAGALERRLDELSLPEKGRKGAHATALSGSKVPNAYKYARIGTIAHFERGATGWFLVSLRQCSVPKTGGFVKLFISEIQEAVAVKELRKKLNYGIKA